MADLDTEHGHMGHGTPQIVDHEGFVAWERVTESLHGLIGISKLNNINVRSKGKLKDRERERKEGKERTERSARPKASARLDLPKLWTLPLSSWPWYEYEERPRKERERRERRESSRFVPKDGPG